MRLAVHAPPTCGLSPPESERQVDLQLMLRLKFTICVSKAPIAIVAEPDTRTGIRVTQRQRGRGASVATADSTGLLAGNGRTGPPDDGGVGRAATAEARATCP